MALPSSGAISTTQIMNELGVPVQVRDWAELWSLAKNGSTPKNKANAGGPYVLPNDWWGYTKGTVYSHPISWSGYTYGSAINACGDPNYLHDFLYSSNPLIAIGDVMYTQETGGTVFNGNNYWFHNGDFNSSMQINTVGVVINVTSCVVTNNMLLSFYLEGGVYRIRVDVYYGSVGGYTWNSGTLSSSQFGSQTLVLGGINNPTDFFALSSVGRAYTSTTLSNVVISMTISGVTKSIRNVNPVTFTLAEIQSGIKKEAGLSIT